MPGEKIGWRENNNRRGNPVEEKTMLRESETSIGGKCGVEREQWLAK